MPKKVPRKAARYHVGQVRRSDAQMKLVDVDSVMEKLINFRVDEDAQNQFIDSAAEVDHGVAAEGDQAVKIICQNFNNLDLFVNPQSTFAELKSVIAKETGLNPEEQKLLFRGNEMDDHEHLHTAGVKNNAKIILIENLSTESEDLESVDKPEEVNKIVEEVEETVKEVSREVEAVIKIRDEDDQYAGQVASLDAVVCSGTRVADKDIVFLTEMLMRQLLKLHGIKAEGEGRILRKSEVRRVQGLVDTLDNLRTKNASAFISMMVTQEPEVFDDN